MKALILALFAFLVATFGCKPVLAAILPQYQDIKLPTQAVLEHQTMTGAAAANANLLLNAQVGMNSHGNLNVLSFVAQPDTPRSIKVASGASVGSASCHAPTAGVIVSGTDFFGRALTEVLNFSGTSCASKESVNAFASVTQVVLPPSLDDTGSATWSVGSGTKLGLKRCMDRQGDLVWAELAGVRESTYPTVASTASTVSQNTVQLSSTLNGSDVDVFFVQNFRCLPQ